VKPFGVWLFGAFMVTGAASLFEGRVIWHKNRELGAARLRFAQLDQEMAEAGRRYNALTHDLQLAEKQLDELQSLGRRGGDGSNSEIASWLGRLKRLQRAFDQRSDQRIPEMRLLTDADWALLSQSVSLDSDEDMRRALAAVRTAAKTKFAGILSHALYGYEQAMNGQLPPSMTALTPYLSDPTSVDLLQRYQMITPIESSAHGTGKAIIETAAVDTDYDTRVQIQANSGWWVTTAPMAWIPDFQERQQQARLAYVRDNPEVPMPALANLLPYFNPPLDPATTAKVLQKLGESQR
jgi:hypothetical protein